MGVNTNHPQTVLQWETLFSKIANTVDNLSMAKRNTSNATNLGYEFITPNRLKLEPNNYRSLEGSGIKLDMSLNLIKFKSLKIIVIFTALITYFFIFFPYTLK